MFATVKEVKELSNYEAIQEMRDAQVDNFILRADIWINSATNYDYLETENKMIQNKLKVATIRLVDYLFYFDQSASVREKLLQGLQSESTTDYSYTMRSEISSDYSRTGDRELDLILNNLKVEPNGFNFFKTSNKRGDIRGIR